MADQGRSGQGVKDALARVLVVSPVPPPYAGPEVITRQLLDSPLRERYRLIHYDISKRRGLHSKGRFDVWNILYGIFQPLKMLALMLWHRPHIVYTLLGQNAGGFLRYAPFVLVASMFRTPLVVRIPGNRWDFLYERSNGFMRALLRYVIRRIDAVVVRADILKRQFEGLVAERRLYGVYSGISAEPFDRLARPREAGILRLLYVGYLSHAKGALDLLEAIPRIREQEPGLRVRFVGEEMDVERNIIFIDNPASNARRLRDILDRSRLDGFVEFTGRLTGDDLIRSYVESDIFVFPSYAEALPTVVLEAMAAGMALVVTPVGALPEILTDQNALFVQPGDTAGIAAAVLRLVRDPQLREGMGRSNRELFERKFTDRAYADRLDTIFQELLQRRVPEQVPVAGQARQGRP